MRAKNILNEGIYIANCNWKYFELKKYEITGAAYQEYLKLKDKLNNRKQRRKNGCKSK